MLSSTADNLFWMARYTERAENTARMLDVNVQNAMLPQTEEAAEQGWRAMLGISELEDAYAQRYREVNARDVIDFMARDPSNPSSIFSCLASARENARAVRGSLTTEVWEIQNTTWLELQGHLDRRMLEDDPSRFFEWVKYRSHLSRGVTIGTMLKDEAFHFIRLGTHLERADNTARILDVKFHGAQQVQQLQQAQQVQTSQQSQYLQQGERCAQEMQRDFYHWAAVLRSVSAFEIYRKVYRDVITPERVAELLMLRPDMPRSLLSCMNEVLINLEQVRNDLSADTERFAGRLHAQLRYAAIDDILKSGLHAYLDSFLADVYELGNRISRDFLLPLSV
jgi:uncharacterized alpha-E superfamily protein